MTARQIQMVYFPIWQTAQWAVITMISNQIFHQSLALAIEERKYIWGFSRELKAISWSNFCVNFWWYLPVSVNITDVIAWIFLKAVYIRQRAYLRTLNDQFSWSLGHNLHWWHIPCHRYWRKVMTTVISSTLKAIKVF